MDPAPAQGSYVPAQGRQGLAAQSSFIKHIQINTEDILYAHVSTSACGVIGTPVCSLHCILLVAWKWHMYMCIHREMEEGRQGEVTLFG